MRATITAVGLALVVALGAASSADAAITLSGPTGPVDEPASGTVDATYTITRSGLILLNPATVTVTITNLTAVSPGDYAGGTQTVDVPIGLDATKTFKVPIAADLLDEDAETFKVQLTATTQDTIDPAANSVTTTITDDAGDIPPTIAITAPAAATEGTGSAGPALSFPVPLSAVSGRALTVAYTTSNGTATANSDYTSTTGTLTIPAGQAGGTISVAVLADAIDEDDETLNVTLSSPVNATLGTVTATGTITDDDSALLTVSGATVFEGRPGSTTKTTTLVSLSLVSAKDVTVSYATADGTAVAPGDYLAATGQVRIAAGQRTATIPLSVVGDAITEPDEVFAVSLAAPTGAAVAADGGRATIVIRNDDGTGGAVPANQQGTVITKPTSSGALPGIGATTNGVTLGQLKFDRSTGRMRFVVSCPAGGGRCKGSVTVFSVPAARSRSKSLRHEQQLATKTFELAQGAKVTAVLRLPRKARSWLRSARSVKITAYAVCRNARGAYSTAKVAGTLKR